MGGRGDYQLTRIDRVWLFSYGVMVKGSGTLLLVPDGRQLLAIIAILFSRMTFRLIITFTHIDSLTI